MQLSIIVVTRRLGGLDFLEDSLTRQTIWSDLVANDDVELILVDEHAKDEGRRRAVRALKKTLGLKDSALAHVYPEDYDPPRYCKLARAHNTALRFARGDYLFFVQDYIWLPSDALERALTVTLIEDKPILWSAKVHLTDAIPTSDFTPDRTGVSSTLVVPFSGARYDFPNVHHSFEDVRTPDGTVLRSDNYQWWECNVALCPRRLAELVGWDEELDKAYSYENQDFALRARAMCPGLPIIVDGTCIAIGVDHRAYLPEAPTYKDACTTNMTFMEKRRQQYAKNAIEEWICDDRPSIAFVLRDTGHWGLITPDTLAIRGLGGRETAAVRLARELASKHGWKVAICCPTTLDGTIDSAGVLWCATHVKERFPKKLLGNVDVLVAVEDPVVLHRFRAKINVLHEQCAHLPMRGLDKYVDHYFLLSHYQQWALRDYDMTISADKCVVFGNGIDLDRYDSLDVETVPGRFVYSSSPDRGLIHLLRWWPTLKAKYPHISLKVFYGIDHYIQGHRWLHDVSGDWARIIEEGRSLEGVEYVGTVNQARLAVEQKQAQFFVYPCDPEQRTETFAITCLENAAARVPMLLSNADCLPEVYGRSAFFLDLPINDAAWIEAIGLMIDHPDEAARYVPHARALAENYTWTKIAARWDAFLRQRLTLRDPETILRLCEDTTAQIAPMPDLVPA